MGDLQSETEYYIQTRFISQTEYVFVKELNVHNYLKACGEKFLINFDRAHDIHLYNHQNATIEKHHFEKIVRTYWRSASFCINLVATPQKSDCEIINPKVSLFMLTSFQLFISVDLF